MGRTVICHGLQPVEEVAVKLSSTPPKESTKHMSLGTSWWTLSRSKPFNNITLFRGFKSRRGGTNHGLPLQSNWAGIKGGGLQTHSLTVVRQNEREIT
jgi:hypothetical protein